jgi:predicted metal-dependent phosphoesterase TrpH
MTSFPAGLALARADLHVHSHHSRVNGNVPFLRSRDCYSDPLDVYRTAKRRGMDIVTITDHDSIAGCVELLSRMPDATDILTGEEVSCRVPDTDLEVHLGVYGLNERDHDELQRLRGNVFETIEYLRGAGLFFALNHLLHFFRHQLPLDEYLRLLALVPAIEVQNGTMLAAHNALVAATWAARYPAGTRAPVVAGSDAHTLRRIGRTWTEAPGRTAGEFLESLRAGLGQAAGAHGGSLTVAGDAYGVVARYGASVLGHGPKDHKGWHRLMCAACVIASPPAQFLPLVIAMTGKRAERRIVREVSNALRTDALVPAAPALADHQS